MGRFSFDQMMKHTSNGGSSFFNLKEGEEARVRFLYNVFEDIEGFTVHEFNTNGNYATIVCARQEGDPKDACKWCMTDNRPVNRVIIPLFNEDNGEIQYWKRSEQWVKDTMLPQVEEVVKNGAPISSQVYKVKRKGKGLDTVYSLIAVGGSDGKKKEEFGEIKDPFAINMIRESDYDFDPYAQPTNNQNQGFNNQNYNNQGFNNGFNPGAQATRRTTDVF